MAEVLDYFEPEPTYDEGPFVVTFVEAAAYFPTDADNKYRVECRKGHVPFPVLPAVEIIELLRLNGYKNLSADKEKAIESVDLLNQLVKRGDIVEREGLWLLNKESLAN